MTMKKQDRKAAYVKVTNALISGDNELAYNEMVSILADDVDLFVFANYQDARDRFESKKEENADNK
ncbi:hypothetical protein MYOV065v1_p0053 [Vibrio phage PS15B.2]|nr:hypothetical protein MYOV065v1_p0053 [Vibrio phage PS15B.2]QZI90808.1 hypothetical protein MYOV066v1_p0030 [Vibrio phage PS15B.3]QZI90904.1 hypothetical protein MYOV064v1_p0054 [Vibrio phage PS15B.4]